MAIELTQLEKERGKYLALFREDVQSIRDELTDTDRLVIVNGIFDWFLGREDGLVGVFAFLANRIKDKQLRLARLAKVKAEAGRAGGLAGKGVSRGIGNQNARKDSENESKTKAKRKQTKADESKTKAEIPPSTPLTTGLLQDNNNILLDGGNMSERGDCQGGGAPGAVNPLLPSESDMRIYAAQIGVPESYIKEFLDEWRSMGWQRVNRGGSLVTLNARNFKSQLGAFWRQRQRNAGQGQTNQPDGVILRDDGFDYSRFERQEIK